MHRNFETEFHAEQWEFSSVISSFCFEGKNNVSRAGTAIFLSFATFSEMTYNGIWPKKWLRLAHGHFCIFFYLFPQNDMEWSYLIHNFSHWHLMSKIFILGGGFGKFFVFQLFQIICSLTHNGKFGQKHG